jgi:peptidyl-prolyl cis-trans isomerase D
MFIVQDLMRKHRRLLLWIILVLIVGPFVLWGGSFGAGSGGEDAPYGTKAIVSGEMTISADDFRQALYEERDRMAQFGRQLTMEQMLADGTALRVLESLVSRDIIAKQAAAQGYEIETDYIAQRMKELPDFQDQNGNFDPVAWNSVVERGDVNWNLIYGSLRDQIGRELYLERLMASGRVLESELKEQFERENTTLSLRYIKIEPPVEPTDEQIQATYDANPEAFSLPAKRKAAFVAISVEAPKPALADELVKRARAGENFATLAVEHSQGDTKEVGGDVGWIAESLSLPEHQKVLFALAAGDVSEPVKGPAGYYIYKVDEERVSELSGQRDVKAREIVLHADLDPEEMEARRGKAEEISAKAQESKDLAAVAAEYDLEIKETGMFASDSLTIENVPADDTRFFRATLSALDDGAVSNVVTGRENLYVAKITGYEPPQTQPFEEVRETVRERTIAEMRRSAEYATRVQTAVSQIQAEAATLEDIPAMFPDMNATIETVEEYSLKEFNFGAAPPWMPRDLYAMVGDKDTGVLAGPLTDMIGDTYFVEVASRTLPSEEMWEEEWPEAQQSMRLMAYQIARQGRLDDRLRELRETTPYPVDQTAFMEALGLNEPAEAEGDAEPPSGVSVDVTGPDLTDEPTVDVTLPFETVPATEAPEAEPGAVAPDTSAPADDSGNAADTATPEPATAE